MKIKINIEKIFSNLMNKDENKKENFEQKEKENIKEVSPAISYSKEDTHGGTEATKDIKDSPSNADNGENKKENSSSQNGGDNSNSDFKSEENERNNKTKNSSSNTNDGENKKENSSSLNEENKDNKDNKNASSKQKKKWKDIIKDANKNNKKFSFSEEVYSEKEMTEKILVIIKKCLKESQSNSKGSGYDYFDCNKIAKHLLLGEKHKIPNDKFSYEETKTALFFMDTSGSLSSIYPSIIKAIELLIKQGYQIFVAGCGNGFWDEDADDDYYNVRRTLSKIPKTKIAKVARPTFKTAARMANEADISFVVADFDGLSTIVEMALECQKHKIPYFLSTEDRYSWADPTEHDWVNPDYCTYPRKDRIFDVSWNGNPM